MSKAKLVGCEHCEHIEQDYNEGYGAAVWCNKTNYGNLKSFPFKKEMPCFELNCWHDEEYVKRMEYDFMTDTLKKVMEGE